MGTITRRGPLCLAAALVVLAAAVPAAAAAPEAPVAGGYRMVDLGIAPELDSRTVAIGPRGLIAGWTYDETSTNRASTWRVPGTAPPRIIGPESSYAVAVGRRGEVFGEIVSAGPTQVVRWWRGEQTLLSGGMVGQPTFIDVDSRGRVLLQSYAGEGGFACASRTGPAPATSPASPPRCRRGIRGIRGIRPRSGA
jgi:hypothetical protein